MRKLAIAAALIAAGPGFAAGLEIDVKGAHTEGTIVIDLREDLAPNHVAQITALAEEGFYNGVYFHRVIDGFMAQTGDGENALKTDDWFQAIRSGAARRYGTGGSSKSDINAEFTDTPFDRGIVGMARSQSENSANSQFFIMFGRSENLDGQYTVVGEVTSGMEVVDNIKRGDASTFQITGEPDQMVEVRATE